MLAGLLLRTERMRRFATTGLAHWLGAGVFFVAAVLAALLATDLLLSSDHFGAATVADAQKAAATFYAFSILLLGISVSVALKGTRSS